ncbi:hypothetical protein L7F22_044531 [Adiantum nelumboides]|nr:hypothetical protein [Adiantum nelumboides]
MTVSADMKENVYPNMSQKQEKKGNDCETTNESMPDTVPKESVGIVDESQELVVTVDKSQEEIDDTVGEPKSTPDFSQSHSLHFWIVEFDQGELGSCGKDELPILSCRETGSSGSLYMEGPQSDETQKVQQLRARLQESIPQSKDIDDGTLVRFLRARSLNVDKALKFLLQHLKWCQAFKPLGFIPETEIAKELKKEKIFLQGLDKLGRPIGVILAARHFTSERNLEEFKRFVVYGFDKAVASLAGGQDKFVLIADLKRYGFRNMDVNGYLAILEILQDHFPERLGKFYILHVPSLFWLGWKVVYPFIDPNVREKIIFVDEKRTTETLLKDIDVTQLPEEFGGQLPLVPIQHVGNSGKACSTL